MLKFNHRCTPKSTSAVLHLFIVLGVFSYAEEEQQAQPPQSRESKGEAFSVMDFEAMKIYRDGRYAELTESLANSNLSTKHQELVANAIAKMYVGIPVSSYEQTTRTDSLQDEPIERTERLRISVAGYIQREPAYTGYAWSLDANKPFKYFPFDALVPETGILIDESDTAATFVFDFHLPIEDLVEDNMLSNLAKKMNWLFEITVSKAEQSPEVVFLKLEKPVRKRFLFKLSTFEIEMRYSFIASCGCHAVSKMKSEMKGSALIVGRLAEFIEITVSDVECKEPLQFLLPENYEASFLMF